GALTLREQALYLGRGFCGLWREPLSAGVLLLLVSAAASTVFSISPRTSFRGADGSHAGLLTVAGYVALFFATRTLCRTRQDARRLLAATVVAAAAASAYALLQLAQLDPVLWGSGSEFGGFIRPAGPLGHANFLAAFAAMALPVTLLFAEQAARARKWLALA